ncbi:MAG: phosphatase [Thermoleophilia bacterium]|nr:phosphatase [Thermoleophilia bacterium]
MNRKALVALIAVGAAVVAVAAVAAGSDELQLTNVATANTKSVGYSPASRLSRGLAQIAVAQGATKVENPQGIVTHYGYENDVPSGGDPTVPLMTPAGAAATEAQKTEPDKNTYLVLENQHGADPSVDYGTHFLFQGHEAGAPVTGGKQGYITRINLDADSDHRVTVLATHDATGAPIATIDGSTWDPFARRLLLTTENTANPTYAATVDFPSTVTDVSGALGRGGYEGIQDDSDGNIWIVEDIGGANKPGTTAKIPNSFIFRYVPAHRGDLANGKLQALQVLNAAGAPITQESQTDVDAPDQVALHSYGTTLRTQWVTVHDTAVQGSAPFNANLAAKKAHATPFKRPENGVFRPGSHFGEFFFTETGDTNATSAENDTAGGWGSLFKLSQSNPSASTGTISVFFKGTMKVTGLDNIQFLGRNQLAAVEDAGDTLHGQRNALDSGYAFDTGTDFSNTQNQPVRFLAEGRDPSATIDSATGGFGKNDGDNEITGIHVSNGDPGPDGILGAKAPHIGHGGWRWFYTQQHGDNYTFEVVLAQRNDNDENDD